MARGKARTFDEDLMRGEGGNTANQAAKKRLKAGQRETASLKGGLTFGTSCGPYDGRQEKRDAKTTTAGGAMGAPETTRDMHFYAKKRAVEATLGRELTIDEFLSDHYVPLDQATASGTSIFDPVLCELVYRWFCPPTGTVLDPFAGGSVRGVVAGVLGLRYVGIDLREEQVVENRLQAKAIFSGDRKGIEPRWVAGDSAAVLNIPGDPVDLVFSCPPYADLEVYSDDPRDLSTMGYEEFRAVYDEIVAKACARLRPDRFAVFVVGDVRGPDGNYRSLPQHTIDAFRRAGLALYNDAVLVTAVGSLPVRASRQFVASRKLGTTHQRVLVFLKGDPKKAAEAIGPCDFGDFGLEAGAEP